MGIYAVMCPCKKIVVYDLIIEKLICPEIDRGDPVRLKSGMYKTVAWNDTWLVSIRAFPICLIVKIYFVTNNDYQWHKQQRYWGNDILGNNRLLSHRS